ncbi:MAG: hypothetical protein MUC88_05980 [Planctomycetes bacterium]|nr:hypothetical protein [Planctomycetota bacterium]
MRYSGRFRKALSVWALLFCLCAGGLVPAAQPASGDPLRIIPADALVCVRLNKLTDTLGQMDQFLTGISPVGPSMPVRAQLAGLLGQPEPAGINMAGDIAVFWPLPGGEKPDAKRIGVLVPLSDFQQFLTNPNVHKTEGPDLVRIGPQEKPLVAGVPLGNYLLVTPVANQLTLAEAKNWTSGGAASLSQRLGAQELKRAAEAPVWAYANIQIAGKMLGPKWQEGIKEFQKRFQAMQAPGQAAGGPPQGLMEMWVSMVNSFLQEIQFLSLTLEPSAAVIRLAPVVAAVPNTEAAKILSMGASAPSTNLTGYMQTGAIMTGVANLSPALLRSVTLKRVELTSALLGPSLPKPQMEQFRKLAMDYADVFAGEMAWSFLPVPQSKPPFGFRYVATIKDRQKFSDVLDQSAKLMSGNTLADLGKMFGLKMQFELQRNVESYKDIRVDAIRIALQSTDANSPQGQMIQAAYGAGLDLRLAVVNNLLLYTLSADAAKDIHGLIDQAKAGGPGSVPEEIRTNLQQIPDAMKSDFFGIYNYVRAIQMMGAFLPIPIPNVASKPGSAIAFAGDIGDGRLQMNLAIPKQQVLDIKEIIQGMQPKKLEKTPPQKSQSQREL